jgi:hypothetical protein
MIRPGDPVETHQWSRPGTGNLRIPAAYQGHLDRTRVELVELVPVGEAAYWPTNDAAPPAAWMLCSALALGVHRRWVGALVHNTVPLGWHRDRQAPPETDNLTVVFRHGCDDGYLVVSEEPGTTSAWTMPDGYAHLFDNQLLHGVTPYTADEGGYRMSLTIYLERT